MSFVVAGPEMVAAAAADLAAIRTSLSASNHAVAVPTIGLEAPAADAVSAAVTAVFGSHAETYQMISAQTVAFHDQLVMSA